MHMHMRFSLICATLVLSSLGYSQIINTTTPDSFQMGYATYLNAGDSSLILSNGGASIAAPGSGNICVNTYVFDTREELNECCACVVTPDGFRSMSAKNDLTKNLSRQQRRRTSLSSWLPRLKPRLSATQPLKPHWLQA